MTFIYRLFPTLLAFMVGGVFYWQLKEPAAYPWIAVFGVLLTVVAAYFMSHQRVKMIDLVEKMAPTGLFLMALIFGMLLAEGQLAVWAIIIFGAVATFLSFELLFLHTFMPSRYPINGLSHVNIAYVPFIVWYVIANSVGLMTFLHSPAWMHVVAFTILSVIVFRTTGHPGATREQNRLWMFIGGLTGLHIGLLGMMLPLSMSAQATLGMVIFCAILRLRRYMYHPIPIRRQAWLEGMTAIVILSIAISTAKWI